MIPDYTHLVSNIFDSNIERKATRDGFGKAVVELGEKDERVVVLCGDVAESVRANWFQEKFPERYVELGVAEQNLAGVASGLAAYGKIPFAVAYAAFSPGRNYEQIRTSIALNDVPVILCGMHTGVSVGADGATHQMLEDIALMRALPNMQVIVPADFEEAKRAVHAVVVTGKPAYLRFGRMDVPSFTTKDTPFAIGRAEYFWKSESPQVAIMACGNLVHEALVAAKELAEEGIQTSVLNMHSVKPMDIPAVISAAKETGAVVAVEDHQLLGGLGSTVAEVLAQNYPVPMEFVAVHDKFGQSGTPKELLDYYGVNREGIKKAVKKVIARKR